MLGLAECLASRPSRAWTGHPRLWGNLHHRGLGWATRRHANILLPTSQNRDVGHPYFVVGLGFRDLGHPPRFAISENFIGFAPPET